MVALAVNKAHCIKTWYIHASCGILFKMFIIGVTSFVQHFQN